MRLITRASLRHRPTVVLDAHHLRTGLLLLALLLGLARGQEAIGEEPLVAGESAQPAGMVVLKSGGTVQGDILELVRGDHVTVRGKDGQSQRFPWDQVAVVVGHPADTSMTALPATDENAAPTPSASNDGSAPSSSASTADWPQPDRTAPGQPESRLSLGIEGGYGSPLGIAGAQVDYYPWQWLGLEVGAGLKNSAEMLYIGIPLGSSLEYGFGLGFAQLYVTPSATLPDTNARGVVQSFTADVTHFSFFFTRNVMLRAELGLSVAYSGAGFCTANPGVCSASVQPWGTMALFWNFDLSPGQT